jgi:acyl-CoA dehydrogenase family protein 9
MPTFKRADQEQIEKAQDLLESAPSGPMGFVKSLFFGRLSADQVLPYPVQDADEARRTDELIARVDTFLHAEVNPDWIDAEERIPPHVICGLSKLGVLGMTVPTKYGGGGFSHTAYCRVLERISAHCASTAVLVGAHQSIGLKALILMGTEEQKQLYLPSLACGDMLAAFCLSEPEVGSDAAGVQTSAKLSSDGSHWLINGHKRYATNSAIAGLLTVMAKTPVTENGRTRDKVTAFLVNPHMPGFRVVSRNRSKCGVRGSWQGTLEFVDVPVPNDQILGELGKGLKVALSVLNYGRCTLSAGCVGGAKKALEMCVARARSRKQFGRSIGEFQLIKKKIARMAEDTFAMDAMTYLCAGLVDRHAEDLMLETAIAKLFCSEALWRITDDAVQIWGGEGYMREHGLERMLRDARINRIVEGTTEVMTAFIALVGMKGVGEEFEMVLRAAKHPVGNFGRLAHFARNQWDDILIGHDFAALHPDLADEGQTLGKLTTSFARSVSKLLRTYRERILDMQLLQERVAWCAADLYASAAVISKLQSMLASHSPNGNGHDANLRRDVMTGKRFCHHAAERVRERLRGLFVNSDAEVMEVADAHLGKLLE